ncbi:tyrosine-type recombinase/integrase [Clostridium chrysemydis]|uniref:tyrosine-type recombinase/integrase n=1 Tax=Clostridium chrysemydis TaxID=2665504 RepID=UPI0018842BA1|nr:tyrosine-type recombinase/integrase [Clostridium chrysemydis]
MQGSVRKKGSAWYYRYYAYVQGEKKQIEKKGGKTKKEALEKLNEQLYLINNNLTTPSEEVLTDYLDMWLNDYIKDEKSENTYDKYKNVCNKYIKPIIGNLKLKELKVIHIEKFLKSLKQKDLSSTSMQMYFGVLKTSLNKAVKLQLLQTNPCIYVDTPKRDRYEANILTLQEFKLLYNSLNPLLYNDSVFLLALDLTLETGLRRGEMCGLTWESIDFINKTLKVNKSLIRIENHYSISAPKTNGSYRTLPLSDSLLQKLKRYQLLQKQTKLKYGSNYTINCFNNKFYDLVFTNENGKFILPSSFLQRFKRLLKNCGIEKNIRWHDLRHTNATLLLEGGVDFKTLQSRLGHTLIGTTMDIYAHVTE